MPRSTKPGTRTEPLGAHPCRDSSLSTLSPSTPLSFCMWSPLLRQPSARQIPGQRPCRYQYHRRSIFDSPSHEYAAMSTVAQLATPVVSIHLYVGHSAREVFLPLVLRWTYPRITPSVVQCEAACQWASSRRRLHGFMVGRCRVFKLSDWSRTRSVSVSLCAATEASRS